MLFSKATSCFLFVYSLHWPKCVTLRWTERGQLYNTAARSPKQCDVITCVCDMFYTRFVCERQVGPQVNTTHSTTLSTTLHTTHSTTHFTTCTHSSPWWQLAAKPCLSLLQEFTNIPTRPNPTPIITESQGEDLPPREFTADWSCCEGKKLSGDFKHDLYYLWIDY